MLFENVCLEAFGYALPEEVVASAEIERRLAPLYERLRLPPGRLEAMTGIAERRFFPPGMPPSEASLASGRRALAAADVSPAEVGLLIHGSVCRDFLEPATAAGLHHQLGLPPACLAYDVSNACLGLLNGVVQAASLIESGRIQAALVVGTESGRDLVENTIATLNADATLTRQSIKSAVASLTIGSASCALLLVHRDRSRAGNRLLSAAWRAHTEHHELCRSGRDEARDLSLRPLMETDSEALMREGIAAGVATFGEFLAASGWSRDDIDYSFCHQVGATHRKLMLDALGLDAARDFTTFAWLGNTGACALPVTLAVAVEQGRVRADSNLALLGIGSGINCLMLGVRWRESLVLGGVL